MVAEEYADSLARMLVIASRAVVGLCLACSLLNTAASEATPSVPAGKSVNDPCDLAFPGVWLKSTRLERGRFYGTFAVRLKTLTADSPPFVIEGRRRQHRFYVDEPTAAFEFRDVNGRWSQLLTPPGDFDAPPDQLSIPHQGRDQEIVVELPPAELASQAIDWRMTLRTRGNLECIQSAPFRVRQSRGPVRGFVSQPVPKP